MAQKEHSAMPLRGRLNTLAQSGTTNRVDYLIKPPILVNGEGSLLNDKVLMGRAKRKMITQKMVLSLIDVVTIKKDPNSNKSYWNTYYCQGKVYTSGNRLFGRYCKNRYCTICCSIRKAHIMNRYLPIIKEWEDPYFVTLTVKAVPQIQLRKFIKALTRGFKKITAKYRKRYQRGKGVKLKGIKSIECNFNPVKKTYNPHLHIIVPDKQTADILINEWLKLWTNKFTNRAAQDKRQVEDKEGALIEIVKYGSKIFTEPDLNKKSKQTKSHNIYTAALDNIFTAMKGVRIFERFGFDLPATNNLRDSKTSLLDQYEEWEYYPKHSDWLNSTGERSLAGYIPPFELSNLLEGHIDTQLE